MKASGASRTPKGRPWTVAEVEKLGRVPDSVLAERTGHTIKEVAAERDARGINVNTGPRRWTARELKLLGTMADRDIGQLLRRSRWSVNRQRRLLKIPAFKPKAKFKYWSPEEIRLLGTMPDEELAVKLNRTVDSIKGERFALGIPIFEPQVRQWTPEE